MNTQQAVKITEAQVVGMTRKQYLSYVFKVYASARKAARNGAFDSQRLNRALGIVMSKHYHTCTGEDYITTMYGCTCKDWEYATARRRKDGNGQKYAGACKHQIALMMETRINEMIENDRMSALFGVNVKIS